MQTSTDDSPLAKQIPAPGITELGVGNQLLPISHGSQQISLIGMKFRRTPAKRGKTFARHGIHPESREQAQRLIKRLSP